MCCGIRRKRGTHLRSSHLQFGGNGMSTRNHSGSLGLRRPWRRAVALLAVAGLALAACGGDDDDAGDDDESASTEAPADTATDETTGEAPTGDPIKVMTVTTLNAAGPTYENIANT